MEQPWRIGPDGTVHEVPVHRPDFARGDWGGVERWLGVGLPGDYKALIGDGPALVFDHELVIASPFSTGNDLVRQIAYGSWSLATLRHSFPEDYEAAFFPEPGGLLSFGSDGGGGVYYWDTGEADPAHWTVLVSGRPVMKTPGIDYGCALAEFIAALSDGSIESESLGDWPGPEPRFRSETER